MTGLLLIRHAETDMAGRFCGHSDPELNERGRQQLTELLNRLSEHPFRRVYSSDLRRAEQTAEAIARHRGAELQVRPELREIHFGRWEGLAWNEIEVRNPFLAKSWAESYPNSTAPGGESSQRFVSRVRSELAFLLTEAATSPIAAMTHAGFIRVALTNWYGLSQQEAWDRTKEYGSIVALAPGQFDSAVIRDSALRHSECYLHATPHPTRRMK